MTEKPEENLVRKSALRHDLPNPLGVLLDADVNSGPVES